MDILLINGIEQQDIVDVPYLGHLILNKIIKTKYSSEVINFNQLIKSGVLHNERNTQTRIVNYANYIVMKKPKIAGFHTICNYFELYVQVAQKVKELDPNIIIVFGGPQATMLAGECLEAFDFLDLVCIGEGEKMILPLMDALINNCPLESVPGIAYRDGDKVIRTNSLPLLSNEELGNYTLYDFDPFELDEDSLITIEGGRGCPYSCSFCATSSFWGRKYRVKPADVIINEMKTYNQLYGLSRFDICHDLFTADSKYLTSFCKKIIDEEVSLIWGCSSRTDVLTFELIDLMFEANCRSIFVGIETGSQRMQNMIHKNLDLKDAIEKIKYLVQKGMSVTTSFIYGYADETIEDFKETIKMIEELYLNDIYIIQFHQFTPLPKTEELTKVEDKLYFDENKVGRELYDGVHIDEETKKLIIDNPKLFTACYSFDTEVREKYSKIEDFVCAIIAGNSLFKYSIKDLIKNQGIIALYEKYERNLKEIWRENKTHVYTEDELQKRTLAFLDFMICNEMEQIEDELSKDVYRYEHLLYTYTTSDKIEREVNNYSVDVVKARNTGALVPKKCKITFSKGN